MLQLESETYLGAEFPPLPGASVLFPLTAINLLDMAHHTLEDSVFKD